MESDREENHDRKRDSYIISGGMCCTGYTKPYNIILFLCFGIFVGILLHWGNFITLFAGVFPGICLCLISHFLPEHIGAGDGWMLMGTGVIAGWRETLLLLQNGLFLMLPVALFWGVVKKERKRELPFAPFVMGGYLCQLILESI